VDSLTLVVPLSGALCCNNAEIMAYSRTIPAIMVPLLASKALSLVLNADEEIDTWHSRQLRRENDNHRVSGRFC